LVNESAEVNELESETDAVEVETESVKVEQEDQRLDIGADSTCVEDKKVDAIVQQTFILESDTNQESCDIDSDSDSDQGEWITPTNISKQKLKDTFGEQPVDLEVPLVACMTNDYAMQVLKS
jgi:rRNA maturation endonuclease Nob1